jgi:hypothetical protein
MYRAGFALAAVLFASGCFAATSEILVGQPVPRPHPVPFAVEITGVPQAAPVPTYAITRTDKNFRVAIKRWATDAGWEFEPEHWAVARDIPVAGSADFGADFKEAVRTLLKSSELADQPAQPCFYSNKVLRVVPINELCARTSSN